MSQNPNLFLSVGKPVKDEYGRVIGKVASFAMTPNGKFDAVFIEFSGGQFSKQPMEQLKFTGSEVTYISTVKAQSSVLCDQIPLMWRKDQALKDLSDKKISPDMYTELHTSFDSVLSQLKKDAKVLSDQIADQVATCDDEIKAMTYAILNLEIEHEIGRIDDESYKSSFGMLQDSLKRTTQEKTELEMAKSKLANTLLGDNILPPMPTQKTKTTVNLILEPKQELPEPPVVVYVKEIGKAGI